MIWIYDKSIAGCCTQSRAVGQLIFDIQHGAVKGASSRVYRRRRPTGYQGIEGNATLVFTNDRAITKAYKAAGIPVRKIPSPPSTEE